MSQSNGLPTGWAEATIGDVVQVKVSQDGPEKPASFVYVDISSVNNESKRIDEPRTLPFAGAPSRARQRLEAGDVLVSMTRPNLNAVAVVPDSLHRGIGSTGFDVLRPKQVASGWLFVAVQTNAFIHAMCELVQGALYPAVRPRDIRAYRLLLPPLPEQHRIVEKIEELFSHLDAAVVSLQRAKANLKRYRASVLKAAVEGRLTEEWRKEHPQEEDGPMLLDRILRERREKWEREQLAKFGEKGKEPPKNWQSKYEEPAAPDASELPELPEGWVWATVEQLASDDGWSITDGPFGSNLKTEHYTSCGPLVIRLQNIGDGYFKRDDAHISNEHFAGLQRHSVHHNDIVVAMLGEALPRACLVPEDVPPAIVKADCVKVTVNRTACIPAFLMRVLNSQPTRRIAALHIAGVGRPRLNLQKLRPLAIPLPPLAEQHQIVALVEERLSQIDAAEQTIDAELLRAKRLRQSILKQAFAGKLVPQDPNDEPASVLLERIKASREQEQPKRPKKAKRVKAR